MVKYLEKGEKSLLFYTFCQLHLGVVNVHFFLFNNSKTKRQYLKGILSCSCFGELYKPLRFYALLILLIKDIQHLSFTVQS